MFGWIYARSPAIDFQVCANWGIDIFSEPVPVTPAAHYWMGGIVADQFNQTSIPGLYAVGETASTGVHGANRLASNSLLECLVFGSQMAHLKLEGNPSPPQPDVQRVAKSIGVWEMVAIEKLRFELPQLVWQSAGICRGQRDMESAIARIEIWRQEFISLPLSQSLLKLRPGKIIDFSPADDDTTLLLRNWGEVYNLLDIGYLILKSAAFRTESRGGHYRLDYPLSDVDWCRHTLIQNNHWEKSNVIFNPGL
jgi:L-aspartate oxidase